MEYVEGASLKDLIERGLTAGEAIEIIRQILAGARFAHSKGIIHRDLKPQNVLIDREGRARVADFGIARAGASEITQTGSVLGTAQYLSPEQAQGLEITAASDLYSVGAMLYEALTGQVPFDADTPVAVALKQVSEQPRPPSAAEPEDPARPRRRGAQGAREGARPTATQSADEFSAALDAAEADPTAVAATPPPTRVVRRARRPSRRPRRRSRRRLRPTSRRRAGGGRGGRRGGGLLDPQPADRGRPGPARADRPAALPGPS